MSAADAYEAKSQAESTEEEDRVCPLLSTGLTSGTGKTRHLTCIGDKCAWWNRTAWRCSITAGPETNE